jgi:hypothetical protein
MKTITPIIPYKKLRRVNPEAARLEVISYLKANKWNKSEAARAFNVTRPVVYYQKVRGG